MFHITGGAPEIARLHLMVNAGLSSDSGAFQQHSPVRPAGPFQLPSWETGNLALFNSPIVGVSGTFYRNSNERAALLPESRGPGTSSIQQRPNILVRAIARWGVSIRLKLLIAFLGIAISMAGLALFDLSALQQANARTEQLLQDLALVAVYIELDSAISIPTMMVIASADYEQDTSGAAKFTWLIAPATSLADLKYLLGQSIRRFGWTESLDGKRLIELRSGLSKLSPVIGKIAEPRRSDNRIAIKTRVYAEFAPIALGLQRDTYTIKRQIEDEVAQRARLTAIA